MLIEIKLKGQPRTNKIESKERGVDKGNNAISNWITNYSVPKEPFDISIFGKRDKEETKN